MQGYTGVMRRRIVAHHLILTLYGHWGVNDPRGSGSVGFYDEKFEDLGPIHRGRKPAREQPSREELRAYHAAAGELMSHRVLWLDAAKRQATAEAFGEVVRGRGYTCYACAVLTNHAHVLIRIHRDEALTMWQALANESRLRLRRFEDVDDGHPVWGARPYKVFLYTPADVERVIGYIEGNPGKEGLEAQRYAFVKAYDGWPLHKKGR
jgi:REP-associated tyrosine transposase